MVLQRGHGRSGDFLRRREAPQSGHFKCVSPHLGYGMRHETLCRLAVEMHAATRDRARVAASAGRLPSQEVSMLPPAACTLSLADAEAASTFSVTLTLSSPLPSTLTRSEERRVG